MNGRTNTWPYIGDNHWGWSQEKSVGVLALLCVFCDLGIICGLSSQRLSFFTVKAEKLQITYKAYHIVTFQ